MAFKYNFNSYKNSELDLELLNLSDKNMTSKILLLEQLEVYSGRKGIYNCLSKYDSIETIKNKLSQSSVSGKNILESECEGISNKRIAHIIDTIEFYEQQVIRLLRLYKTVKDGNFFFMDKEEKDRIVKSQILEIANYLNSLGNNFIYGEMNNSKKNMLIERLQTGKDNFTVRDIVDTISNYVTIEELEFGIVKTRALDRFKRN